MRVGADKCLPHTQISYTDLEKRGRNSDLIYDVFRTTFFHEILHDTRVMTDPHLRSIASEYLEVQRVPGQKAFVSSQCFFKS